MADISAISIEGVGEYDIKDKQARDNDASQDDALRQIWAKITALQATIDSANSEIETLKSSLATVTGNVTTAQTDITTLQSSKVSKAGDTLTGALDWATQAVGTQTLQNMAYLGTNLTSSTTEDTRAFWAAKGTGFCSYNATGRLNGQPSQWGFLVNIVNNADVQQEFIVMPDGIRYYRGANGNTSAMPTWRRFWDDHSIIPIDCGGTNATNATSACQNLIRGQSIWPASLELGGTNSSSSGNGGFIDFHFNGSTADNTSRIIEDVNGQISINGFRFVKGNAAATRSNLGLGDSGWHTIGANHGTVWYRKVGNIVCVRGSFSNVPSNGNLVHECYLPTGYRPSQDVYNSIYLDLTYGNNVGRYNIIASDGAVRYQANITGNSSGGFQCTYIA